MGRKKDQFVAFAPWQGNAAEKGYIRLTPSLLKSPAVMGLNPTAFRIFIYMNLWSGNKPEFTFTRSLYERRGLASRGGFQKAVDELVMAGFIEIAENNAHRRKPNVYRFSDAWKNTETARAVADAESL